MSKNKKTTIDAATISHVAKLANIPITDQEKKQLAQAFAETLDVVSQLQQVPVENIEPTHQVTNLTNIMRTDKVEPDRMLSQKQALANAQQTHQGYFVVPRILEK